eukprot:9984654-Alexandrium_andersonii.AAC.1
MSSGIAGMEEVDFSPDVGSEDCWLGRDSEVGKERRGWESSGFRTGGQISESQVPSESRNEVGRE